MFRHTIHQTLQKLSLIILLGLSYLASATQSDFSNLIPDPKYSPTEVVKIQMSALQNINNPYDGAGIEITYRFASPSNKANTGPLERFKTLFNNPIYSSMLNYSLLEVGPVQDYQTSANVPIIVTGGDGKKSAYIFRLNKQTRPPYENCWMTSAVISIPMDDSA